jgi:RNA polymerase sigma-70 factor (ECF subfamily)
MSEQAFVGIDWAGQFEQHQPWLRRVLRCRIGNRHEVDDLMQEIALAVFRQNAKPIDAGRIAPWLYRLAVRQAINFHRREGRKSTPKPTAELEVVDRAGDPLDWLLASEMRTAMQAAISRLPIRDREILMLKYTEDWSYRQLASHLGVQEKTIEYRLLKARQRLRSLILSQVGVASIGNG